MSKDFAQRLRLAARFARLVERHPELLTEGGWFADAGNDYAKAAKQQFDDLQKATASKIGDQISDLQNGKITGADAFSQIQKDLTKAHGKAYGLGKGRMLGKTVAMNADDAFYLRRAMEVESQYLKGFINDIVSGKTTLKGKMGAGSRGDLYARSLRGSHNNARVEYAGGGDDGYTTECAWLLDIAENCPDCISLSAFNPWSIESLPTVPGAGDTQCGCLTSGVAFILTEHGEIPLRDVNVGDLVLTHKNRWRKVLDKPVHRSTEAHDYVCLVGKNGLQGYTGDHRMLTERGWLPAREIASNGLFVLSEVREAKESDGGEVLQVVCGETRSTDANLLNVRGVRKAQKQEQRGALLGVQRKETQEKAQRLENRPLQRREEERRSGVRSILGRKQAPNDLSLSMDLGESERADTERSRGAPSQRGSDRRPVGEPEANAQGESCCSALHRGQESALERRDSDADLPGVRGRVSEIRQGGGGKEVLRNGMCVCEKGESVDRAVLLSTLLQRVGSEQEDPCIGLLRNDIASGLVADREVRIGEVVPLGSALPIGSPLHDLTVEEDASFVCDGMIVHNSKCKCHLKFRQVRKAKTGRGKLAPIRPKAVRDVFKLPEPPSGLTLPTATERVAIEDIRQEVNYWRRTAAEELSAGNEEAYRRALSKRRVANAELNTWLKDNKVYSPPAFGVDEVIAGKVLDERLVEALMSLGLDGATIAAMPKAAYKEIIDNILAEATLLDAGIRQTITRGAR